MSEILLAYATTDGHTLQICQRLGQVIGFQGHRVTLLSIAEAMNKDIKSFDKIILGASIRYGKHGKQVYEFVEKHEKILESKPNAFFSVNVVARKPEKNTPETNPYLIKFLKQISWQPRELAVFAGKIDYQKYRFWDRQMIRLIMWMTKGPTAPKAVIEFTDWNKVDAFGRLVSNV